MDSQNILSTDEKFNRLLEIITITLERLAENISSKKIKTDADKIQITKKRITINRNNVIERNLSK
jgi:hypothetical protein